MGGYQLPIARHTIRGRCIADRITATELTPNQVFAITLDLPSIAYMVRSPADAAYPSRPDAGVVG